MGIVVIQIFTYSTPSSIIPITLPACYTLKTNGYSILCSCIHYTSHKAQNSLQLCVYNKYHHAWHQV